MTKQVVRIQPLRVETLVTLIFLLLSLWERLGEGLLAITNPFWFSLDEHFETKKKYSLAQLNPHPGPLPEGEGVSY